MLATRRGANRYNCATFSRVALGSCSMILSFLYASCAVIGAFYSYNLYLGIDNSDGF